MTGTEQPWASKYWNAHWLGRDAQGFFDDGHHTWRFVQRGKPTDYHEDVDGRDCYWFHRGGGERLTDVYTIHIIPVETFWGRGE